MLTQKDGDELHDESLWLFTRSYDGDNKLTYSVGFFTDEAGYLKPVRMDAFCYFPTKETTNLKFVVHAPFLLTDSREGIKAGEKHNDDMIRVLAKLAADAMEYLKDIGTEKSIRLIDDKIGHSIKMCGELNLPIPYKH